MKNQLIRAIMALFSWSIGGNTWAAEGQFSKFHVSFDVLWMAFIVFGLVILIPVIVMMILSWKSLEKEDRTAAPGAKE